MAFVIATGFVADTTSLPLVISNLVNIVSANYFAVTFDRYAAVMVPVDAVALAATLAVLWLFYGRAVPARYPLSRLELPSDAVRDRLVFRAAFPLLGLLLAAYFVLAPQGVPVSAVTGAGALALAALAGRWHRGGRGAVVPVGKVLRGAPWQIVIFSSRHVPRRLWPCGRAGLTGHLAAALAWLAGHGLVGLRRSARGFGAAAAVLGDEQHARQRWSARCPSSEAHTIPAATRELMVYANVIGCDLGPKFTPIGSLATLLWLHVLGNVRASRIGWGQYMRVGLVITPPVLLVTLAALVLWLPLTAARHRER